MSAAVDLHDLTKTYGTKTAVDNLTLTVPEGSIYGFIGPNGSGKTTTIRMILRIILPDRGTIRVLGSTQGGPSNDAIAYLPEERGLYRKMKVIRQLSYFGELQGMSGREAKKAGRAWLERLGLADWENKKVEALSKGMSQKVQFIAAIMARPRLLILDEPFSGLDPVNLEVLREVILELRKAGTTIIFSTHDMNTAEQMCDRIFMIYQGKKVLDGSLNDIQATYGADTVRLALEEAPGFDPARLPGVSNVRDLGRSVELRGEIDPQVILHEAMQAGRVTRFEIAHPSLQDIFVRIANPQPEDMEVTHTETEVSS